LLWPFYHTPKPYVRQAFAKYLECGIFAHGFARARCDDCGHDYFVAFSCKGRGVCPSCNTRRMVQTAAHLSDHVFPRLPVRQWVLSVPKRLRYFMQGDAVVLNMVLRIFLRVIAQSLQAHGPGAANVDKAALHLGAVAFIHRFSSDITCKQVSLHCNFVVARASISMSTCTSAWSMGCLRKYRAALQAMTKPLRRT
jgi:hypothetical protein